MPITRRTMLATVTAALAAQGATNRLPRRVRCGLVGADGHPTEILRPLPEWPDVELTAIAHANSDAKALAGVLKNPAVAKARRYKTAKELLDNEPLDLVAVCNNDGERAAAVLACLEKRLPTIAEKPLAINRDELRRIIQVVERDGLHLGMLLPMRFDPPFRAMRDVVESGEVGEILQIDAQKSYQLDERPAWQKTAKLYGSTIVWIGPHMIDLMMWASGRQFQRVVSLESHVRYPELGDMQNITASLFEMDNRGIATLRMDYLRPGTAKGHGDDRLRLAGTKGIVEYQESTGVTVMSQSSAPRQLTTLPPQGSVFGDFLASVFLNKTPALSWKEIVRVNEVTLMAEEAARTGSFSPSQPLRR